VNELFERVLAACVVPTAAVESVRAHVHGCPFCIQQPLDGRGLFRVPILPRLPFDTRRCPHVDQMVEQGLPRGRR
jgi:hypothetical protein